MAGEIEIKEGEGKWITFNVTRSNVAVDLSTASDFLFAIKETEDSTTYLFAKSGESFDKAQASSGIVRVNVSATESLAMGVGTFVSELKIVLTAHQDVDKSQKIPFIITKSIIDI